MISYGQAIVLGLLQGFAELFPISSLGQSVILPSLLGWNIHQNDPYFITFLVATHLATALVLLGFFWSDWVRIVKGLARSLRDRRIDPADTDAKLAWLLVIGTIPAGLLGLLLEHPAPSSVRLRSVGRVLPDPERPDAVRRRVAPPSRTGGRGQAIRTGGSRAGSAGSRPPRSARRRRSR